MPSHNNGEYAWLEQVAKSLKDDGKTIIVMSQGVLFRREFPELFETVVLHIEGLLRPRRRNQVMALAVVATRCPALRGYPKPSTLRSGGSIL
jgi:hypothetical protein